MEKGKDKFKRYLISTAITFVSAFGMTFLMSLETAMDGQLTTVVFFSMLSGAVLAGVRAVAKYLYELLAVMPKPQPVAAKKRR